MIRLLSLLFLLATLLATSSTSVSAADRPNIIVIMVDDMGFSDLGCYGGEVQTPNVDALAKDGLRFTSFYNNGKCCPTRASLLTGIYAHQAGVGEMTFERHKPGYRGYLTENTVTVAELLRKSGYRTAMVGKWHVSQTNMYPKHMRQLNNQLIREEFSDLGSYPVGRGFEEHYGIIWGVANFFDPFSLVHNTTAIRSVPKDYYITDDFSDHAVEYIDKYTEGDEPMFLYVAYTAPHWPLHARPEDIKKYEDTYKVGWQAIRESRYKRQVAMGLIDPKTAPLSERFEPNREWEKNPVKDWDARAMAVHAAMIDRVDQGVGRMIAKLKEKGELDNTLILFLSDNGASPEEPSVSGFDRPSETRDGRKVTYFGPGKPRTFMPGSDISSAGIGPNWANAVNTPYRHWKGTQHEGGHHTPLVAHWPKGLRTQQGGFTRQSGHVIDIMATCLDLAGAKYPKTFDGRAITPIEGKSLVPILEDKTREGHDALFFEHYGNRAVRQGDWKLVALERGPWELYHLKVDETELNNLAEKYPERVKQMTALWDAWAKRANVDWESRAAKFQP